MSWLLASLLVLASVGYSFIFACTTGVVSGKATLDGRPLLWKNRDAKGQHNRVVYSDAGRFAYIGVVGTQGASSVWMGVNEMGFAIENSVSRDRSGKIKRGMGNGQFMRHALENCANVEEFEQLLEETNESGRRTMANFGVIDANGAAIIFETGNTSFKKFDANCSKTAPKGYIVRSNFSMTGTGFEAKKKRKPLLEIYSGDRYQRAEDIFAQTAREGKFDYQVLLRVAARDIADGSCTPIPGTLNAPRSSKLPEVIDTKSTIARKTTVSAAVFQGVRPGENPLLSTMWTFLGDPTFTIAVPAWVAPRAVPLAIGPSKNPLTVASVKLRDSQYTDEGLLETTNLHRIWAETLSIEDEVFAFTESHLNSWREVFPDPTEIARVQNEISETVASKLANLHAELTSEGNVSLEEAQPAAVGY